MGAQVTFSEQQDFSVKPGVERFKLERAKPILFVPLYLILPNLAPLLSAGTGNGLPHGYINLEFLLIGAAGMFLPRGVLFAALLLESVLDFAYGICYTYRFSLGDLTSSTRYLTSLPKGRLLEGLVLLSLSVAICGVLAAARPHPRMRTRTIVALLLCTGLPIAIDAVDGQNLLWPKDATLTSYRLVRAPAAVLALWEVSAIRMGARAHGNDDLPMPSASAGITALLDRRASAAERPNVVLILVESWGLLRDARLAKTLTAAYDDARMADKYEVSSGAVPFTGLTVPGEARELCHSTAGFGILNATPAMADHCLPALLHARGYENVAIHGFVGQMFYRDAWYPKLGFDQSWFGPDLHGLGLPNCPGAFPGTCDTAIAGWISTALLAERQEKPRFIYWVTLNSHLPEPAHPNLPDDGVCDTQTALRDSAALCSWFRLVRAVHQSVEQAAMAPAARPTVFVLVGDHAPPFGDPGLRAEFSGAKVPYVMLTPVEVAGH